MFQILTGDCVELMKKMDGESVDMCVTSPPYWGLRDYGHGESQLGLEATPEEYIDNMVKVFREVKRVLKPEGTLWLNIGDSYNGSGGSGGDYNKGGIKEGQPKYGKKNTPSLKPKDLVGIPWMLAFALRADGWWLRQDIIWAKPSCMPESVTDRCTKNHEYVFLLSKNKDYYYDHEAIKEDTVSKADKRKSAFTYADNEDWAKDKDASRISKAKGIADARVKDYAKRNKRSVWWVGPKPLPEAHFAVFPIELIEPCILAGTSAKGNCSTCGNPWKRVVEKDGAYGDNHGNFGKHDSKWEGQDKQSSGHRMQKNMNRMRAQGKDHDNPFPKTRTVGWEATCECETDVTPAVVFDPFGGSGTTAMAAIKHGRKAILTELSEEYVGIAEKRITDFKAQQGLDKKNVEWL